LNIPVTQKKCMIQQVCTTKKGKTTCKNEEKCINEVVGNDIDINSFAPFSHDAQSNGHSVPEPSALLLLGSGLLGLALYNRRRFKK